MSDVFNLPSNARWTEPPAWLPERPVWMRGGACRGAGPDVFFPEGGGNAGRARDVCRGCPVRVECLEHALASGERFGVWGGMSERERRRIRRARGTAIQPGTYSRPAAARRQVLAVALRQAGHTATHIARDLGVDRRTVHRYLEAAS